MRNKLLISIAIIMVLLTACAPQGAPPMVTPMPTSIVAQKPTYTVERGEVSKVLELRGRVSALRQQDLFFSADGVVDEVLVSRGDTVQAGQVLAYLTGRESYEVALAEAKLDLIKAQKELQAVTEEAELRSAEALVTMLTAKAELEKASKERLGLNGPRANEITIAKAEAIFAQMEKNLKKAQKEWAKVERKHILNPERTLALFNLSTAMQQYDQALAELNWYLGHAGELEIDTADGKITLAAAKYQEAVRKFERIKEGPEPYDLALAEATVTRSQVELDKAQASLDGRAIIAPYDGQVLSLTISPGTQVTAYKSVATVVDPEGLEITLQPTSSELAQLGVGQEAQVLLPNRPGQELSGVIHYIPLLASGGSGGQNSDQNVRVSIEDEGALLNMGEVATVLIRLEERENVLWVSPAALRTFQGHDFVIMQDGEVQRRVDIRLGLRSQDRIEVLEGLDEGQVLLGP